MKKVFSALLSVILIIFICCVLSAAEEKGGKISDSLSWSLQGDTLSLNGTGTWEPFGFDESDGSIISKAPWAEYADEIRYVTLSTGISDIADYAFAGLKYVKSVSFSSTVKSIGNYAFYGCEGLEKAELNEGAISLGDFCFADDVSMTEITVSSTVRNIGKGFTAGDTSLVKITVSDLNREFMSKSGAMFSEDMKTLIAYPAKKSELFIIPDGVETLGEYSFAGAALEKLYIPESVKTVCDFAFRNSQINCLLFRGETAGFTQIGLRNESLDYMQRKYGCFFGYCGENAMWYIDDGIIRVFGTGNMQNYTNVNERTDAPWKDCADYFNSVIIENGITEVSEYAFYLMKNIKNISLGKGVKSIGKHAFSFADIEEITIPSATTSVSYLAFYRCSRLTDIKVSSRNKTFKAVNGILYSYSMKTLFVYPYGKTDKKIYIPYGTTTVSSGAFIRTRATSVYIPNTVKTVKSSAFKYSKITNAYFECSASQFSTITIDKYNEILLQAKRTYNVHVHTAVIKGKSATCTASGLTAGLRCEDCGKIIEKQETIPAKGHKVVTDKAVKATMKADGKTSGTHCSVCSKVLKKQSKVYKIKSVSLSASKYVYNGKAHKPSVKITDSKGKALKNSTDYKLKYSSSKSVGINEYSVTITFCGKYSGKLVKTYKILPGKTKITKITSPGQKTAKLTFSKVKGAGRYAVFYSASKSGKYARIGSTAKCEFKYSKLKSGKTGYFKVIAYKTVNGKNIYGAYSDIKSIKVK